MKKIELIEKAKAEKAGSLASYGINSTMYWAYNQSKEIGNDLIDFHDVIWDKDIEPITNCLKENGIEEFTVSCTFSGLISTLAAFEKYGFKMDGLTEVNAPYTSWGTGEYERIPAVKMIKAI